MLILSLPFFLTGLEEEKAINIDWLKNILNIFPVSASCTCQNQCQQWSVDRRSSYELLFLIKGTQII